MEKREIENQKLRLMVFKSALELGRKVDYELVKLYNLDPDRYTFMLPVKENFFSDGHLKVEIGSSVRGKNIYALTDIGNYSIEYKMHGFINHTSPNDLMMQLKDGIGACNGHASGINIIMPLLYAGRQHRRNTRENLMCGATLHELEMNRQLKSIITFDAHDPSVEHALHYTEFDNVFPSNVILKDLINDVDINDLLLVTCVAPDNGANGRRNIYLNSLNSDFVTIEAGSFYKQRDYNKLVNGKNPVTSHDYCGNNDLKGKTAIVSDDMISSGGSIFDVIDELKKRGVKKVYIVVTYALFTEGIDKFRDYYNRGLFDGIYTTNLSYIPEDYKDEEWLHVCDCSKLLANIIYNIHNDLSISKLLKDKSEPIKILNKKVNNTKIV
ncbi:MAG: ribose-phosphate diphosphokinase [Bacilli bacterium]|nr:ribose-phosphate diphosphokinase [Bacilli bacterium]